jgi:hypothetical protein
LTAVNEEYAVLRHQVELLLQEGPDMAVVVDGDRRGVSGQHGLDGGHHGDDDTHDLSLDRYHHHTHAIETTHSSCWALC